MQSSGRDGTLVTGALSVPVSVDCAVRESLALVLLRQEFQECHAVAAHVESHLRGGRDTLGDRLGGQAGGGVDKCAVDGEFGGRGEVAKLRNVDDHGARRSGAVVVVWPVDGVIDSHHDDGSVAVRGGEDLHGLRACRFAG
jgi:hypothetical protein